MVSRRGEIEAPVRLDPNLKPGLAFITLHFPDEVDTNQLTIEAWDPKSGTSEFKATAIRSGETRRTRHHLDGSALHRRRVHGRRTLGGRCDRWGRTTTSDTRGGLEEALSKRHLLLPALNAVQGQVGWVSPGALDYISRRLTVPPAEAYGVATFYALLSTESRPRRVAHVCDDIACQLAGAEKMCGELETTLGPEGGAWFRSPCLGQCERAPAALLQLAGEDDWTLTSATAASIAESVSGKRIGVPSSERRPSNPRAPSGRASHSAANRPRETLRASTTTGSRAATARSAARSSSGPKAFCAR